MTPTRSTTVPLKTDMASSMRSVVLLSIRETRSVGRARITASPRTTRVMVKDRLHMMLSRIPSRAMRPRACGRMVETKDCAWAVSFVICESREPPGAALTVDEDSRVSLSSMRTRRRSWKRCPVNAVIRCEATLTAVLATAAPVARRPGRRMPAVEGFWGRLSMMRWSISGETVLRPA